MTTLEGTFLLKMVIFYYFVTWSLGKDISQTHPFGLSWTKFFVVVGRGTCLGWSVCNDTYLNFMWSKNLWPKKETIWPRNNEWLVWSHKNLLWKLLKLRLRDHEFNHHCFINSMALSHHWVSDGRFHGHSLMNSDMRSNDHWENDDLLNDH